jgi:hypothetical protein
MPSRPGADQVEFCVGCGSMGLHTLTRCESTSQEMRRSLLKHAACAVNWRGMIPVTRAMTMLAVMRNVTFAL